VFAAMTRAQKKAALSIAALASRSGLAPDATGTCFSSSGPALPLASSRLGGPLRGDRPRVHAREKLDRDRAAVRRQQIAQSVAA